MADFSKEIRAYALKNAIEFGKADAGRILPKIFQHGLEKKDIKNIILEIAEIVSEVNKLNEPERSREFEKFKNIVLEHEQKEKDVREIDVSSLKEVVTRLAPEPSKYIHLGHALSFLLNYIYAKKYGGKCLLRFEDANPEKAKQEYADAIKEDIVDYLGIKLDGIHYVSDDILLLYEYAVKLIKDNYAYMCFCERKTMQNLRHEGKECDCRKNSPKKNLEEWADFLKGKYMKGEAVLRIKGDMKNQNHVMRDSVIFRAVDCKHYRRGTKYKIWPMYDFYNPIEDSLMGVTLILRSNEFETRVELQNYIRELLGLKKQMIVQYGRINVKEFTTKGREVRDLVESGALIGWDDPRLITLRALKRRGIVKESYYELLKQIGLVNHPVNLEFDMLAAINRKLIDSKTKRYSFVQSPIGLDVEKAPEIKEVDVQVHPDKKEFRKVWLGKEIFISKEDFDSLKGREIRLMHLCNLKLGAKLVKGKAKAEFTSLENKPLQKINWVSSGLKAKILMDDGKWTEGIAEPAILELKVGEVIQFERFGFVRLDGKGKNGYEFWFAHK